jgi:hypothetical protein
MVLGLDPEVIGRELQSKTQFPAGKACKSPVNRLLTKSASVELTDPFTFTSATFKKCPVRRAVAAK